MQGTFKKNKKLQKLQIELDPNIIIKFWYQLYFPEFKEFDNQKLKRERVILFKEDRGKRRFLQLLSSYYYHYHYFLWRWPTFIKWESWAGKEGEMGDAWARG